MTLLPGLCDNICKTDDITLCATSVQVDLWSALIYLGLCGMFGLLRC